ncbi:pseudouridine-5'-phosphate glycosidase [Athalassotoga saccharophila]|uniref:pseudouridine-5'-phosphate glycosidase n=1 Tax=Athalassotoga saccharophila TaxID=1441386 RepID=UPI00137B698A|nr:pseudouridine-5'-phosphate glycosidase [Athalassotoga saccharophila]BBJ28890.1 pseudouridine-5'-phosphate glycosidase [Athalassotoga saccharophila]
MNEFIDLSSKVKDAIDNGIPVVSLESTIISHGMPYPKNIETARALERIVEKNGCVPATIAVLNGRIKIGLKDEELEFLARSKDILKLSRMDLPYAVAKKLNGATTVAATMLCSHMAGIKVFATGGVGGVHRGVAETFDISADLVELSKTPVIVVSAGVKSILDIPKTLEILETLGVTVLGYKTDYFPSFYSHNSGSKLYMRADSPQEVANLFNAKLKMGLSGGILVANPIEKSKEIPNDVIDEKINLALNEAKKLHISGKAVTPFLLSKIVDYLPEALEANVELVKANAELAAKISKSF